MKPWIQRVLTHWTSGFIGVWRRGGPADRLELADGTVFDQYVMRLPRCAMTAVPAHSLT